MKKITICIVMALLCPFFNALAQEIPPSLKIGEKIPDSIWNRSFKVINTANGTREIKLSEHKRPVILLDFWTTYCTACIEKFSFLQDLQEKYKDQLKVILVGANMKMETEPRMMGILKGYKLPSIVKDDLLKKLFPHRYVPHYIWLSSEGKLLAITNSEMVTEAMIRTMTTIK
ncbi:MAG: TlpA family protein disulfide reductase [Pedobacter sp.]|nr:MAG: TlpA family protein disulfide reductase [Pedobacter sp.]